MFQFISKDKIFTIADLAHRVEIRQRTPCENMRRVEDNFSDLIDSIGSKEFQEFESKVKSLNNEEFIDLVAIIIIGRGEHDFYDETREYLLKNVPMYEYVTLDVLRVAFFIENGLRRIEDLNRKSASM